MWNLLMDIHLVQTPPNTDNFVTETDKPILTETNYTVCKVNICLLPGNNSITHTTVFGFLLVQCFLQ